MTLARTLLAAATVLALAAAPTWAADVTPFKNDALYKAFHGMAGVDRVTDTMVDLSLADPRVADIFKGQDIAHLRQMLKEHLCYVLGGPCAYTGKSMKEAHKDLGIEQTDFNAVV
jgi:hemoglobin